MDFPFIQKLGVLQPIAESPTFLAISNFQEPFHVKLLCWLLKIKNWKPSNTQDLIERLFFSLWGCTSSERLQFFPEQKQLVINYTRKSMVVFHVLYAAIQITRTE